MNDKIRIPFNKACFEGKELVYIARAIENGHISGDGPFTKQCHRFFEDILGVAKALLTTSCTHALELSAMLLDVGPNDEVIVPSFTFVSTANAFAVHNARIVFCDIRPDTLNMDEKMLQHLITDRTKAIVPVHYAGVGCEMDCIMELARKHGIWVVEDNAHGLFGKYKDRFLGTFGAMATLSFHETKNVTCGEGGAILINDPAYVDRAEIIREKGTNRSRFFRGEVDKYTWVDRGSSYLPSDMLAAFLWGQLEAKNHIQEHRKRIWEYYYNALCDWAAKREVRLPVIPTWCDQSYHMFYIILPEFGDQRRFIDHLRNRGIYAVFHYQPLHLSKVGKNMGGEAGDCPHAEDISRRLVRLPFYNELSLEQQRYVVDAVIDFC